MACLPRKERPCMQVLGQFPEADKAPERVDIPASSHGPAGRKRKRSEEEKGKAGELPCKKRVKGGRRVSVRPIDWKTTFPPTRRQKRKAAEIHPSAAEDTDEPPAKKLPMEILASVPPEYTLVSVEVIKLPSSLELLPGSHADPMAQPEESNTTSCSSQGAEN
ncbi:zinc finger CCCH domain-containing protein 11A-like [Coturnix japonica]|uniref:zinc finger CCCH domain-containing protein 11A-like n=1 Tax=Coturnix japonica TaxID=93934 RepID=UPI000777B589|nr:zinc finger CCCH domain-containing protein 11A-like [Coturnix japonica]